MNFIVNDFHLNPNKQLNEYYKRLFTLLRATLRSYHYYRRRRFSATKSLATNNLSTSLRTSLSPLGLSLRSVDDFASPFSSLDSEEIQQNSGSTIGELLEGQPGVSSTSFGSAASRPVIRGFDGARVRILDSGIEALDASSISVDHAVATEALLLERVEILRGPSTLLYGSSAIGGVVNMIGREIPRSPGLNSW
jgi:iron complex outermembrane receptor protein